MSVHTRTQRAFTALHAALSAPVVLTFQGRNAATLFFAGIALMLAAGAALLAWGDARVFLFVAFVWVVMCGGPRPATRPFFRGSGAWLAAVAVLLGAATAAIVHLFEPQGAISLLLSLVLIVASSITRRAYRAAARP